MKHMKTFGVSLALLMASTATLAQAQVKDEYQEFEAREQSFDAPTGPVGAAGPVVLGGSGALASVVKSFQGISQYDVASFGRNFIPPDTMGAVGKTQFMEFTNGGVAVFDKATGARTSIQSDVSFWAGAGQVGTNGDQRVMYNAAADRWIALSFGASTADIQIAVSKTSDALGPWQSTKFTGFAGGTADYPTLALDTNAVYIGTNNFNAAGNFRGTTLNVIPIDNLFNATGPTTLDIKSFATPFNPAPGAVNDFSRGFAIQGVNSNEVTTTGNIVTVSLTDFGLQRYDVLNAGTAGAVRTASSGLLGSDYMANDFGRQPYTTGVGDPRIIDTLDDRISASAWEVHGRIYTLHTVTEAGSDFTSVRYDVFDSLTNALIDEGDIGMDGYDFYQGSMAVNEDGQVVIAYNRSGFDPADGRIGFFARTYDTDPTGRLVQRGMEMLLKTSDTDSYHNGSLDHQAAAGRQRWGDYSAVTLDPTDHTKFWVIGEFAREFNDPENGHPTGTGGSRWGTFIAEIGVIAVPEPSTWAMLLLGMGFAGAALRRRRTALRA